MGLEWDLESSLFFLHALQPILSLAKADCVEKGSLGTVRDQSGLRMGSRIWFLFGARSLTHSVSS